MPGAVAAEFEYATRGTHQGWRQATSTKGQRVCPLRQMRTRPLGGCCSDKRVRRDGRGGDDVREAEWEMWARSRVVRCRCRFLLSRDTSQPVLVLRPVVYEVQVASRDEDGDGDGEVGSSRACSELSWVVEVQSSLKRRQSVRTDAPAGCGVEVVLQVSTTSAFAWPTTLAPGKKAWLDF